MDLGGYFIAAIVSTFIPWNLATIAGFLGGQLIESPERYGIDVVFPAAMAGLAVGSSRAAGRSWRPAPGSRSASRSPWPGSTRRRGRRRAGRAADRPGRAGPRSRNGSPPPRRSGAAGRVAARPGDVPVSIELVGLALLMGAVTYPVPGAAAPRPGHRPAAPGRPRLPAPRRAGSARRAGGGEHGGRRRRGADAATSTSAWSGCRWRSASRSSRGGGTCFLGLIAAVASRPRSRRARPGRSGGAVSRGGRPPRSRRAATARSTPTTSTIVAAGRIAAEDLAVDAEHIGRVGRCPSRTSGSAPRRPARTRPPRGPRR